MRLHLLFLILFCATSMFAQKDWQLQKNTKGIEVYYRDSEDSYIKELKMTTIMDGSLSAIYALLDDLPRYTTWIYGCSSAELLDRPSQSKMSYYAITDFPWPMSDRDYVITSSFEQDPNTGVITSIAIATSDARKAVNKNMVRINDMRISWRIIPLESNKSKIEYHLKSDPGGNIPAWAVNFALDRGPMQSMLRFRELLKEEKYQQIELPYIDNFITTQD